MGSPIPGWGRNGGWGSCVGGTWRWGTVLGGARTVLPGGQPSRGGASPAVPSRAQSLRPSASRPTSATVTGDCTGRRCRGGGRAGNVGTGSTTPTSKLDYEIIGTITSTNVTSDLTWNIVRRCPFLSWCRDYIYIYIHMCIYMYSAFVRTVSTFSVRRGDARVARRSGRRSGRR